MKACPKCGKRFLGNEEFCPNDGATLVDLEDEEVGDPLVGTTVDGRYQIDRQLGEGGMGVVYLATHAIIGKKCALKVLRGEVSTDAEVAERFTQEARAAAAIGNQHIIEITDFGQLPDGAAYFVMEFLDGAALHDVIEKSQSMPAERVLHVMAQCCDALAAAHSVDIVHRDLKPDNIFLIHRGKDDDFVKILDFGIAKVARQSGRLTRTGMIFGTPQYMSPEQAAGTGVDARTDIYSLGIIMYEMLCGHVPFEADTFMGVLTKHLYEEPIPPRRLVPPVEVPQNVEAVLLKAIQKKPEKRYQTMQEFGEDIADLQAGKTPTIVYDQMRETASTTVPPPPPSAIVGGRERERRVLDEDVGRGRPKWPIFAGIGAVVAIAAVVGVLLLGGGEDDKAQAQPAPSPAKVARPAPEPAPPEEPAEKPEEKEPAAVPAVTAVKLVSDPEGASLFKDGALMGTLPAELDRPRAGEKPILYTLKMDGYEDIDVFIGPHTPDEFEIALERKKAGGHRKKGGSGSSGASHASSGGSGTVEVKVPKPKKKLGDLADPWAN